MTKIEDFHLFWEKSSSYLDREMYFDSLAFKGVAFEKSRKVQANEWFSSKFLQKQLGNYRMYIYIYGLEFWRKAQYTCNTAEVE